MTKRDLIDEVVKLFPRFSRRDAEVMVNAVFDSMTEALRARRAHRDPRLRQLRREAPPGARGAQPEDRRAGAGACEARPVLQGRQGAAAARRRQAVDARRRRRRSTRAGRAARWRSCGPRGAWRTSAAATRDDRLHLLRARWTGDPRERLLLGASRGQRGDAEPLSRTPVRTCMVAPRRHTASLPDLPAGRARGPERRRSGARWRTLGEVLRPEGFNLGMNLGARGGRRHRGSPALAHRAALDRRHELHAGAGRGARHAGAPASPRTTACVPRSPG